MDLTKIDKPFGELDDATKGALLLAAHRGEVIEAWVFCGDEWRETDHPMWNPGGKYRVQPKPVIGEYKVYDPFRNATVTFPTRDGLHVPGVYTSPEGLQVKIEVAE